MLDLKFILQCCVFFVVLYMHMSIASLMTKHICIGDDVTCIFVLFEDKAIASLMIVVTLQVSCVMSHFE